MKSVPEIRFNKHREEWESLNAGTLFYPITDKGYPELPVLSASQEEGMIPRKDIGINMSYSRKNVGGYKRVLPGDFVVHLRSFQGGFAHSASEGITSPAYTVLRLNKERNQDDNFWKHYMTSMNFIDSLRIVTYGIRDGRNINVSEFLDTNLTFPKDKLEQTAIGKFFDDLDEYISSQALELQKLKNIKKACLEKMFPKEGELVPEIRFDGFEGNWEKKPAKKLFSLYSDKGYPSLPVLSASQEEGMILRNDVGFNMSYNKENIISYKRVRPGQFVIHLRSFQGGFAHSDLEGITSPAYTIFGLRDVDNHDDHFWGIYFTSKSFIKRLEKVTYGIRDGRSISVDGFMNLDMTYPSTKDEQSNIAKFFSRLDVHIKAMSDKLDKLKQIRKGLLEKMFVANN
jgi:type I restriction enzyme S subunit